jgi:threonine/homoserine/homoserine lactone efflux protein
MLLTLTPGPIAVVVIRQGVIGNNRRGLLIASGAACMDVLYAFIGGIVMSVINIASPTFLPSLIALSGYLQTTSIVNHSSISNLLYSIGFGLGVFLWLSFLLAIIKKYHSKIPITMMSNIYKIAGYSFLIFAIILTFKIIGFDELIGLNNHNISIPSLIQSNK